MAALKERGVEARQIVYPIHELPPYAGMGAVCPVASQIVERGLHLPTWAGLTRDDVRRVSLGLAECLAAVAK